MIYLRVRGGLCNRMRALDSLFILCKKYNKDLTVLWPMDVALNSEFENLFNIPEFDEFNLKIINCPPGFPESYLPTFQKLLKNFLKGRKLDEELKRTVNVINKIPKHHKMEELFLDNHYNSIIAKTQGQGTVEYMDNLFCETLQDKTNQLFASKADIYINSCYRLHEVIDNYQSFSPKKEIAIKIQQTTSKFVNTVGLHIRRSDHEASKQLSTLEKFINVIDKEINSDSNTTFFISTDDEDTKQSLIKSYGDRIIYNEITSYNRNSKEAVKEAVLDLYCLSKTKKLYGSHHSSFSQVAAKIGGIDEITAK